MQQGEAKENPFRMPQPAEIGAGGIVETDLGAVIGMRPPTHIMQKTGRPQEAERIVARGVESGRIKP